MISAENILENEVIYAYSLAPGSFILINHFQNTYSLIETCNGFVSLWRYALVHVENIFHVYTSYFIFYNYKNFLIICTLNHNIL